MKVAVTGATGTIGRLVLRELAAARVETTAVIRPGGDKTPLASEARVVEIDIGALPHGSFDTLGRPDVLIHLAWAGLPNYRSLHHFEQELPAQYRFLRALVAAGLPSLLVTGTCFEYGMQSGALVETDPTVASNPYGFAKDILRRQLQFLQASHPFHFTWARLFYMYGPEQPETSLFPQLQRAVARGDRTFSMSGGEQLRDYLPLPEVARLIVRLALLAANIGCVNVCSGRPISVRRLVESWLAANGWSIDLNLGHYPYPDYEPLAFWGDRTKLDSLVALQ